MKILITGGCGFLGSNLAAQAIRSGHELRVLDNLSRIGSVANLAWLKEHGTFEFVEKDIRNAAEVKSQLEEFKPEVIVHLAGQVAMTTSIENPRVDFDINAGGTLNILESMREHVPGCGLIYSSTNKVYGDLEWVSYEETESRYEAVDYPNGFDEHLPLEFSSPYGCSKGSADQYILDYSRVFGLRTVVFRHSSMYGGRQYPTFDQGWIGWFCRKALEQQADTQSAPFTISGTGKQVRDVLHADDMKRLYEAAMNNIDGVAGHAFNIGGGMANSLSLLELFGLLERTLDVQLRFDRLPARQSDQKVFVANIEKVRTYLRWEPQVSSEAGIGRMLDWVRETS